MPARGFRWNFAAVGAAGLAAALAVSGASARVAPARTRAAAVPDRTQSARHPKFDSHLAALETALERGRPSGPLVRRYWRPGEVRDGVVAVEIVAAHRASAVRSLVRRVGGRTTAS